jgi:hypothetical protein
MICCPPSNGLYPSTSDMKIQASSAVATPINGITVRTAAAPDYAPINTLIPPTCSTCATPAIPVGTDSIPPGDGNQEVFAFALISHGMGGYGAFVPGIVTPAPPPSLSADKNNNASPSAKTPLITIDHPMVLAPGANYFDDMVVWRTQISLMSELSSASCYEPWR